MHFALLVLALAAVDQATTPTPNPPDQQVERVRAALEKPPSKLTVSEVRADFSVHIEVRRPLQTSSTNRSGSCRRSGGSRPRSVTPPSAAFPW